MAQGVSILGERKRIGFDFNRSLALILWHLARWADVLQASLPDMTPEVG
jgi:hypothetical protein